MNAPDSTPALNAVQAALLNRIQRHFPIVSRPYAALAEAVGGDEADVMAAVRQLRAEGIIRRIGAIFDAAHLGHLSTLVAAHVPAEKRSAFIDAVNALPGVSHNYSRRHYYNLWFTLTAPDAAAIDRTLAQLQQQHGVPEVYSLPALRLYKIRVDFQFGPADGQPAADRAGAAPVTPRPAQVALSETQRALVRALQEDLPPVPQPFAEVGRATGLAEAAVLEQIEAWKTAGVIRRFGASIRHHRAGFEANGMVVFQVSGARLDEVGMTLAGYRQVSHCYHRPPAPRWPYNLFAMTHCRNAPELVAVVEEMVQTVQPEAYNVLQTETEHKKTNVKYFVD